MIVWIVTATHAPGETDEVVTVIGYTAEDAVKAMEEVLETDYEADEWITSKPFSQPICGEPPQPFWRQQSNEVQNVLFEIMDDMVRDDRESAAEAWLDTMDKDEVIELMQSEYAEEVDDDELLKGYMVMPHLEGGIGREDIAHWTFIDPLSNEYPETFDTKEEAVHAARKHASQSAGDNGPH